MTSDGGVDLLEYVGPPDPDLAERFGYGERAFEVLPFLAVPAGAPDPPGEPPQRRLLGYPPDRRHLLEGLDWLLTVECDILNLSIGPDGRYRAEDPLQMATRAFVDRGKPVVVAAGNDGPELHTLQALARAPWVVSVAAVAANLHPLATSSRGGADLPGPTCACYGADPYEPETASTSFAAPRVALAAAFTQKCLELLVSDLRAAIRGDAGAFSAPVHLPWIGIADTGWDPERAPYAWGPIAASLLPHTPAIEIALTDREREWATTVAHALGLVAVTDVTPDLVTSALRLSAQPLDADATLVGFGLVTLERAEALFRDLTASRVTALLGLEPDPRCAELDRTLGPFWRAERTGVTEDAFGTGIRLSVARVATSP